jgi:hypothetical protein
LPVVLFLSVRYPRPELAKPVVFLKRDLDPTAVFWVASADEIASWPL